MSPVQTSYSENIGKAYPGLIKDAEFEVNTGHVEDADGLGFGLPVHQGAADQGIVLGGVLADFLGVSVRDVTVEPIERGSDGGNDLYPQYANAGYLYHGKIWVTASVAVAPGDPVHYHGTTGAWLITGQQGPVPRARWASTAAPGELALIEFR